MRQSDAVFKAGLRAAYRQACGATVLGNGLASRHQGLAVYYGGARVGDIGGPLVKVKRLNEHFPEVRWGFNLAYLLSNTPYLPGWALQILKARRIPIVSNQNGVFYKAWYEGDWQGQNATMALAYHAADWVFYQSEFCRRAAERFLGVRSGQGEVLYNAIDTKRFVPRQSVPASRSPYTFLVTGKIGNHLAYRLENTLAALRRARDDGLDARLLVAGWIEDGARRSADKLAQQLGLDAVVTYSGPYTQSQAPQIYQSADAYVMTKHNDPCPNTVLEAMACGLPVLYSNSGGVPDLVGDAAGVAVSCAEDWEQIQVPDPQQVGEGMTRIAENHAEYSTHARNMAVQRFDMDHWIERHRTVFTRLLGQGAS